MNKRSIYLIGAVVLVVLIGAIWYPSRGGGGEHLRTEDASLERYLEDQETIMDEMIKGMENTSKTGDADLDFLYGMIPHHESAIRMSESLMMHGGDNEKVKKIAKDIINDQRRENEEMTKMLEEFKNNLNVDEEEEKAYLEEYENMLDGHMSHNMHKGGTVDEAFLEGMIMHHDMAVEMSEAILKHTDNEMIINMAEDIIEKQNKEISEMKGILTEFKN